MTGYSSGYQYSTTGQLLQLQASTGSVKTWNTFEYETGTNRVTRNYLQRSTNAAFVTDSAYTYDDAGNITSIRDTPASATPDQQCFTYDYLNRLTDAHTTTSTSADPCSTPTTASIVGGPAPYWHSYTYDGSSNRATETIHPTSANGAETTRTYRYTTSGNRLTSVDSTTGGTTATRAYTYDGAGNTKTRPAVTGTGAQTLDWDVENHLASSTDNGATTTYAYDADGNRILRREPTATTLYLPGLELKLATTTGTVTGTRYLELGGGLTAVRTTTGVTFTASDHHGTGETAVDAATGTVTRRRHTPFGVSRDSTPVAWVTNRGFINGTSDSTGLTHLGAREYDPALGRFVSVDPILALADPNQWNGYAYSNSNPVTLSDPTGLRQPCGGDDVPCSATTPPGGDRSDGDKGGSNEPQRSPSPSSSGTPSGGASPTPSPSANPNENPELLGQEYLKFAAMCAENPEMERCTRAQRAAENAWMVADILFGVGDAKDCYDGSVSSCLLFSVGFIPGVGKGVSWVVKANKARRAKKAENVVEEAAESCLSSFDGATRVLMADGSTKSFTELEVGDEVWATDPETGEEGARVIEAIWVHDDDLYAISIDGQRLVTTEDHPLWNQTEKRWEHAQDLDPGDHVRTPDGVAEVDGFDSADYRYAPAYNLTIAGIHTYYVLAGNIPVLAHNTNCPTFGIKAPNYPGVYVIVFKNGQFYVGSSGKVSTATIHKRLHSAFRDEDHAVFQAGFTPDDVDFVTTHDMTGSTWDAIRQAEQAAIDELGGLANPNILNRRNER